MQRQASEKEKAKELPTLKVISVVHLLGLQVGIGDVLQLAIVAFDMGSLHGRSLNTSVTRCI